MRKRIALFIIGFVLVAAGFLLYQSITGASFLSPKRTATLASSTTQDDRPPTYEQRSPNGDLLYLLSAKKAQALKDDAGNDVPGQYKLDQPVASYYTSDGNLLFIRADKGAITVNDRGAKGKTTMKDIFRGAHLSGNVVLTFGPRESFTDTTLTLKPGQYQVRMDKDLDLNYAEGIVTSPGLVHLTSYDGDAFDGENLTVAFSRAPKNQKIELLRIEPTSGQKNYLLIKHAGGPGKGFSLDDSLAATRPAATRTAATRPARPVSVVNASSITTRPTTTRAAATTRAKAPKTPPTTYKLSFGKEVTATLGKQQLTSDQLFILKMAGSEDNPKSNQTSDTTQPVVASTMPTTTAPVAAATATAPAPAEDDLVVTWTGPMEMRPATPSDAPLSGTSDLVLEAVGTPERPVQLHDLLHTARAGRLRYHKLNTAVELEPGSVGTVVVTDSDAADPLHTISTVTCQGLSFSRDDNHAHLVGPIQIEIPQAALRHATTAPAIASTTPPLIIAVERSLDLDLASVIDPKDPKRTRATPALRHAVFAGRTNIQDSSFQLESDALDLLISTDVKGTQSLEHLLATGNAHAKFENHPDAGITDAAKPDGLNADRIELLTALSPVTKTLIPSRFLATGNVTGWAYDQNVTDKNRPPSKRTIYTPLLDAVLMPKAPPKTAPKATANTSAKIATTAPSENPTADFSKIDVKTLTASDGVIVELEGFGPQTIFAKGKTLSVNRENGTDAATAILDGEKLSDGTLQFAELSQGELGANKITGLQILLDEKNKSIDVPGKGVFNFLQPAQKKGQPDYPAEVAWSQSMHFDEKTNIAKFFGDIDAHLIGQTNQVSSLTAHKLLQVDLTTDTTTTRPATAPATQSATTEPSLPKLHLARIYAEGNVEILAETLDPAGKLLTRLFFQKINSLTYTEATKIMEIPGSGLLLLQDYRPDKIDPNAPDKTDDSNSHGDTAFSWDQSLVYNGLNGTITFRKNVYMKHQPLKPFKLPGIEDTTKPAVVTPAKPAAAPANDPLVLTTQTLVAKLLQSKTAGGGDTIASPLAMGAGGTQKIESVDAQGNSVLTLGESRLGAEKLHFNALTHIATADGTEDNPAEIIRPGQTLTHADHISWDLTKGKNAIEATGVHGTFQQN